MLGIHIIKELIANRIGVGICLGTLVLLAPFTIEAQSPANLIQDISASHGFSNVAAIENTFNNARRQEENQLNLPTNSIQNLDLPSDAVWNSYSDDLKMLIILNDERTSRAGIDYGSGAVKGLAFAGVAQGIDNVSNSYASTLFNNDAFTHTYNGTSPSSRINGAYSSSCREFTSRSENLFAAVNSGNTGFPRAVERAIYGFNYEDAASAWGHREMSLLQDNDLAGRPWGFTNNEGSPTTEGYIGVGVHRGTNYGGFGSNWPYGVVVVMNYFDPAPACTYNVIYSTEEVVEPDPPVDPCTIPMMVSGDVTASLLQSDQPITLSSTAKFISTTTISSPEIIMEPGFSLPLGSCVQFVSDGCNYTGTFTCEDTSSSAGTEGSCASPHVLSCGAVRNDSNSGASNSWSAYGGTSGWSSGEVIYTISMTSGQSATITLDQLTSDLDLFIATSCSNNIALSSTGGGLTSEQISFSTSSGGTIFIIVDGWSGAIGSYRISVSNCVTNATDELPAIENKRGIIITKKQTNQSQVCQPYMEYL